MKLLVVLGALLLVQCAGSSKSWSSDSYSGEMFSVFGWIGYLKRVSVIALMLVGVVLYYVPESRPYARRLCYALIDLTANGLKSALCARESEYTYEKIKSKYQRARYEQALAAQKRVSQGIRDGEDFDGTRKSYGKRSKVYIDDDDVLGSKEKKKCNELSKHHRQSQHRFRSNTIKQISTESCTESAKPLYLYSDKMNDLHKYLNTSLSSSKRINGTENYALLISGSPQQMALIDQKYEKDDVVILQDPYARMEYKECGTSTDKLSSKVEASCSDQEGPTRDCDKHETDTHGKEIEPSSIPECNASRYSVGNSSRGPSQYHCGGGCCGSNGYSASSAELSNGEPKSMSPVDITNVLKSSRSVLASKLQKKTGRNEENLYALDYDSRKVEFEEKDRNVGDVICNVKHQENGWKYEDTPRVRRKRFRNNDYNCNYASYYTDRGGEADDENSQHGERIIGSHDLDEKPQRENLMFQRSSNDSIFDYYEDFYTEPILKNRFTPALARAINWIFGGCPEASRRAALKHGEVEKEETRTFTDEWLL
ncbi:uncharacterized protein LOC143428174 [Xylocopa sonorina]|uniref:uncharacterized protein LOC143428174 n=1 Tax=Xylocopa sonorina TaxID=1818115 RepID=UPI00403B3833